MVVIYDNQNDLGECVIGLWEGNPEEELVSYSLWNAGSWFS